MVDLAKDLRAGVELPVAIVVEEYPGTLIQAVLCSYVSHHFTKANDLGLGLFSSTLNSLKGAT